jgi:hypothetical protein
MSDLDDHLSVRGIAMSSFYGKAVDDALKIARLDDGGLIGLGSYGLAMRTEFLSRLFGTAGAPIEEPPEPDEDADEDENDEAKKKVKKKAKKKAGDDQNNDDDGDENDDQISQTGRHNCRLAPSTR